MEVLVRFNDNNTLMPLKSKKEFEKNFKFTINKILENKKSHLDWRDLSTIVGIVQGDIRSMDKDSLALFPIENMTGRYLDHVCVKGWLENNCVVKS